MMINLSQSATMFEMYLRKTHLPLVTPNVTLPKSEEHITENTRAGSTQTNTKA
ncbi:hypothetical protein CHS0354_000215, partial [Potamilus streckersoni]